PDPAGDQALRQSAHRAHDGRAHRRRRLGFTQERNESGPGRRQIARVYVPHRQRPAHCRRGSRSSGVRADEVVRKRLPAGVVARRPDRIVTASSAYVAAFKKATSTIPIVFASAGNPVEQGFAANLRRPGGNITGVILYIGLNAKIPEIVREALPTMRRLAIL